jgi:hypothetical protein
MQFISFLQSGKGTPSSGNFKQARLLGSAKDWQMFADLVIFSTNFRLARKFHVIIELIVPWKDRMESK